MSATAFRVTIKNLQRRKASLISKQRHLVNDRKKLLLRHALLTAWAEALALLQAKFVWKNRQQDPVQEQLQQLLDEEIALLGELALSEPLNGCCVDGQPVLLPDPGPNTLSQGAWVLARAAGQAQLPQDCAPNALTCAPSMPSPLRAHKQPLALSSRCRPCCLCVSAHRRPHGVLP